MLRRREQKPMPGTHHTQMRAGGDPGSLLLCSASLCSSLLLVHFTWTLCSSLTPCGCLSIMEEIVSTETSYAKSLDVVFTSYIIPLRAMASARLIHTHT